MKLGLDVYDCLCETAFFEINGITADYCDFGYKYDDASVEAEEYYCANMKFYPKTATQEILDKYKINVDEYNHVCKELDALSFGYCGWCS